MKLALVAGELVAAEAIDARLRALGEPASAFLRLLIIPDGPLHRLPFDALSAGPGEPYPAERFSVTIAPSAKLWLRFRTSPRRPPGKVLVLADPSDPAARRAVRRDGVLGALVHARREAEVALSAFPAGSELRTGPPASEAFFRGEGVMSLARAFFGAGASSVVGTLERARDDEASMFSYSFYGTPRRGASVGEAVAVAKREQIRQGSPPAAWRRSCCSGMLRPVRGGGDLLGHPAAPGRVGVAAGRRGRGPALALPNSPGEGKPGGRAFMRRRGS